MYLSIFSQRMGLSRVVRLHGMDTKIIARRTGPGGAVTDRGLQTPPDAALRQVAR